MFESSIVTRGVDPPRKPLDELVHVFPVQFARNMAWKCQLQDPVENKAMNPLI